MKKKIRLGKNNKHNSEVRIIKETIIEKTEKKFKPHNSYFKNYLDYCSSKWYKDLKYKVLRKYNYKCQKCGGVANTAHHLKYRGKWVNSKVSDCIAICNHCHKLEHENDLQYKQLFPNFFKNKS